MKKILIKSILTLFFFSFISRYELNAATLSCSVIPPILQAYLAHHVNFKKLEPELETRTIDQFINRLDPSKLYFLESDVAEIKNSMKGVFKKIGYDCASIMKAQETLSKRVEESLQFARTNLGSDFKFSDDVEIVIDPKLRNWPSSEKVQKEFISKFIQFQMSNYIATDMKMEQAKKQLIHRYELNVDRQKKLITKDVDDLLGIFVDSFATSLDAHSGFLGKDALEDFDISMKLSLEGIGAALTWDDGYTVVDNLIPGGSAEKSGEVLPKDKIIAVAQGEKQFENVIDMPLRDVVRMIRGEKGTTVRLTLLRQSGEDTKRVIVSLKRDKIKLEDEAAKLTFKTVKDHSKNLKIAIIDLPSFYGDMSKQVRSCYDDMKKLVIKASQEKADGLIIDLSKNGGGLLSEAVRIGGLFIKKGNIVATQDSKDSVDMLADEDEDTEWSGPLIILTSRLSASASEIVSGALKDYNRALIVGSDHTFGKGTVQAMMNLPASLGAVKVTTGMFFVPGGASTQNKGVTADIELPSVFSTKDLGESSLDYALPPKSITKFTSSEANDTKAGKRWTPIAQSMTEKLKGLSAARVEKDAEFKKIKTELAEIESNKNSIKLSKLLKKQKEDNAKENKDKKIAKKGRGRRQTDEEYLKVPHINEAVNIMTDMIRLTSSSAQTAAN